MRNSHKFDFSQFSVGDVATLHNDSRPYLYACTFRGLVIDITADTITVNGGKHSCLKVTFDRDGHQIGGDLYELLFIEPRTDEVKQEQSLLREKYQKVSEEYSKLKDNAQKEMMELLKPFIEYVEKNGVHLSLNTSFIIPGYPPNVSLTIHSLPFKEEVNRLDKLIDP